MTADIATMCRSYVTMPNYIDLTSRQLAMLAIICDEQGPHRIRHLAAAIGAQKPVATRNMDAFVKLGFVTRTRDEEDGRDVRIVATTKGRQFRASLATMQGIS